MKISSILCRLMLSVMFFVTAVTCAYSDGDFYEKNALQIRQEKHRHSPQYMTATSKYLKERNEAGQYMDYFFPDQKGAIIMRSNEEHLIIQARYPGPLEDFAWVIPVPARPNVMPVEEEFFDFLDVVVDELSKPIEGPFLLASPYYDAVSGIYEGGGDRGVRVLEKKRVGIYDAVILEASKADSLITWLNANQYELPSYAQPAVQSYVRRKWFWVALRIPEEKRTPEIKKQLEEGRAMPVRFVFTSHRALYPMVLTAARPGETKVALYVLGNYNATTPGFNYYYAGPMAEPERVGEAPTLKEYTRSDDRLTVMFSTVKHSEVKDDLEIAPVLLRSHRDDYYEGKSGEMNPPLSPPLTHALLPVNAYVLSYNAPRYKRENKVYLKIKQNTPLNAMKRILMPLSLLTALCIVLLWLHRGWRKKRFSLVLTMPLLLASAALFYYPTHAQYQAQGRLTQCKSNLKNLGTVLEMYSSDNQGRYPRSLNSLTPKYLKTLPVCPNTKAGTISYGYMSTTIPDCYTTFCRTGHPEMGGYPAHPLLLQDPPGYQSIFVDKKWESSVHRGEACAPSSQRMGWK